MASQRITLIKSQKGSKCESSKSGFLAELDGYLFYNLESKAAYGTRHYWKCKNCPARMTTTDNDIVASIGTHLCEKAPKEVSDRQIKASVRTPQQSGSTF